MMSAAFALFILGLLAPFTKQVNINCGHTSQHTEVRCTCSNSDGLGIEWIFNGNGLTTCLKHFTCIPPQPGYTFSMDSSADLYFLTINSHSYSQCGVYQCIDSSISSNKDSVEISISDTYPDLSLALEEISEPGNDTDGLFSVTTSCLFNVNNVQTKWFTVSNGSKMMYVPENNVTTHVACHACKDVPAAKIQTSFIHTESVSSNTCINDVSFVLEMYDILNLLNNKIISFAGVYTICGTDPTEIQYETNQDT